MPLQLLGLYPLSFVTQEIIHDSFGILVYVWPEVILQSGRFRLVFSLISWDVIKAQMWFQGQEQWCQPMVSSTHGEYWALPNCLLSHSLENQGGSEAGQTQNSVIRPFSPLWKAKCLCFFFFLMNSRTIKGTQDLFSKVSPFLLLLVSKAEPWRMHPLNSGFFFPNLSAPLWVSEGLVFPTVLG